MPHDHPAGHVLLVVDTRVHHQLSDGGYGDRRGECEQDGNPSEQCCYSFLHQSSP